MDVYLRARENDPITTVIYQTVSLWWLESKSEIYLFIADHGFINGDYGYSPGTQKITNLGNRQVSLFQINKLGLRVSLKNEKYFLLIPTSYSRRDGDIFAWLRGMFIRIVARRVSEVWCCVSSSQVFEENKIISTAKDSGREALSYVAYSPCGSDRSSVIDGERGN